MPFKSDPVYSTVVFQLVNLGEENGDPWGILFGATAFEAVPSEEGGSHSPMAPSQSPGFWIAVACEAPTHPAAVGPE